MKFEKVDSSEEPYAAYVVPSIEGGAFIVRMAEGSDFVGQKAIIFGISADDAEQLEQGEHNVLRKYLDFDGARESGEYAAQPLVVNIDVVSTRPMNPQIRQDVSAFVEVAPVPWADLGAGDI